MGRGELGGGRLGICRDEGGDRAKVAGGGKECALRWTVEDVVICWTV